jgi:8-oxo-dGTP diphosphatase
VAADAIIELLDRPNRPIILIGRRNPPYGWAIPGGFVDIGETLERAAMREALEETGLQVKLLALLGCYSNPGRDVRGHVVTAVYVAEAKGIPQPLDDAQEVGIFDPAETPQALAFDHDLVLADYRRFREGGQPAPLRPEIFPL